LASTVGEVDKVARQGQGGTAEMFTTLQALQENFQRALGQIEELQKQIQEIIQSRPEQLKQLEEIRKKYESLLKDQKALAEQAIPARLFSKARDEFQAKQWDEALKSFQTFAQRFGSHPLADNAYLYIGNIHEKRDQLNPAILAYNELVKLYPHGSQVPVALFRLGLLHYKLGRCPQGIAYFRKLSLYRRQAKELAQEAQKFIKRSRQLCKTKNIRRSRPKRKKHR
jgi:TolA-binding protein